jgi:hypothetical protein
MVLTVNSDYFLKGLTLSGGELHTPVGFASRAKGPLYPLLGGSQSRSVHGDEKKNHALSEIEPSF